MVWWIQKYPSYRRTEEVDQIFSLQLLPYILSYSILSSNTPFKVPIRSICPPKVSSTFCNPVSTPCTPLKRHSPVLMISSFSTPELVLHLHLSVPTLCLQHHQPSGKGVLPPPQRQWPFLVLLCLSSHSFWMSLEVILPCPCSHWKPLLPQDLCCLPFSLLPSYLVFGQSHSNMHFNYHPCADISQIL